jgi:hypothetical protein
MLVAQITHVHSDQALNSPRRNRPPDADRQLFILYTFIHTHIHTHTHTHTATKFKLMSRWRMEITLSWSADLKGRISLLNQLGHK